MSQELHFNGFEMNTPSHIQHGLWVHPRNRRHEYTDLGYWLDTAKLLERGLFDALFLADVVGTYNIYQGSRDPAITRGIQSPNNDPFLLVPAMAAVTQHLGFAVTFATTYEPPFGNARRFSTLDHLTNGRVAWNVVTGYLPDAARNFGLSEQVKHDNRYELAEEFLEVSYKLWEGSWEDGAVLRDTQRRIYSDPEKVHEIGHRGEFFTVDGPHLSEPSRQRTPVIYQAGSSERGKQFAARHAEALFLGSRTLAEAKATIEDVRARLVANGRGAHSVRFLSMLDVVVAPTRAEAEDKIADIERYRDVIGQLVHFGGSTGVDLAAHGADEYLEYHGGDHIQSQEKAFSDNRVQEVIDFFSDLKRNPFFVWGTPSEVADRIEEIADESGLDGFNLVQLLSPDTFAHFIDLVVPELQRRGRYRAAYSPEQTLRERLFPDGGPTLPQTHPGASYRFAPVR